MKLKDVLKINNCFCWSEQLLEGREPHAIKSFIKRFNFPDKEGFNILTKEEATKVVVFVKMCPNQCDGLRLVEGSLKVKEILDELGNMDEITSNWGYDKYYDNIDVFKLNPPLPKLGYFKEHGAVASVRTIAKPKTVAPVEAVEPVKEMPKPQILAGLVSPKIVFEEKRLVSREDVEREVKFTLDRIFGTKVEEAAPDVKVKVESVKTVVKTSYSGYVREVTLELFRHILKAKDAYNLEKDYYTANERYSRWDSLRHLGYNKYFVSNYGSHISRGEELAALKKAILADFSVKLG